MPAPTVITRETVTSILKEEVKPLPDYFDQEEGKALLLCGPPGSGKTSLAKLIARQNGTYAEGMANELLSVFMLGTLLADGPDTLILEDTSPSLVRSPQLKQLISKKRVLVERKGLAPELAPTPHLIFCASEVSMLGLAKEDRRFNVVILGGKDTNE